MEYNGCGGDHMNQRQLNMIQAIQDGIEQARKDLSGPAADKVIEAAWEDIMSDEPRSMGLATTAYYAAMFIAWKDRGRPDYFT